MRGVWKDRPRHDTASHGADAFITFACSDMPTAEGRALALTRKRYRKPRRPGGSWMAA